MSSDFALNHPVLPLPFRWPPLEQSGPSLTGLLALPHPVFATPVGNLWPSPSGIGVIPTIQIVPPGAAQAALGHERLAIHDADCCAWQQPLGTKRRFISAPAPVVFKR